MISDKYKSLILFHLNDGALRAGELKKDFKYFKQNVYLFYPSTRKRWACYGKIFTVTPSKVEVELKEEGKIAYTYYPWIR